MSQQYIPLETQDDKKIKFYLKKFGHPVNKEQ